MVNDEGTQKIILEFLENENKPSVKSYEQDHKARYSPATLVNHWYEDRERSTPQPQPETPYITTYLDDYRNLCSYDVPDRKECFKMAFDQQGLGQELIIDHQGFAFYNNFVTTYDLCYNHLKKGLSGPRPRIYRKSRYLPQTDLSKIYGNLTQWGLKERVKSKPEPICIPKPPEPEYMSEYVPYDREEVKKLNDFQHWGKKKTDLLVTVLSRDSHI